MNIKFIRIKFNLSVVSHKMLGAKVINDNNLNKN